MLSVRDERIRTILAQRKIREAFLKRRAEQQERSKKLWRESRTRWWEDIKKTWEGATAEGRGRGGGGGGGSSPGNAAAGPVPVPVRTDDGRQGTRT